MRWQGRLGIAALCCLIFVGSAFGAAKTVATGLGFSVSKDDLEAAYRRYVITQAVNGISIAPAMEGFFQRQILDDLILSEITSLRANAADRVIVGSVSARASKFRNTPKPPSGAILEGKRQFAWPGSLLKGSWVELPLSCAVISP